MRRWSGRVPAGGGATTTSDNIVAVAIGELGAIRGLPWGLPAAYLLREACQEPVPEVGLRLFSEGLAPQEETDLHRLAGDLRLPTVPAGRPLRVVHRQHAAQTADLRPLTPAEQQVLAQSAQAYLLEMRDDGGFAVVGGYAGAAHALQRLAQWCELPAAKRHPFTLLDLPHLAVRGMNRDDAETWALDYWQGTIALARGCFLNLLGISAEKAVACLARNDQDKYRWYVERFAALQGQARSSGIRLVPMIYNVDHMLGQFLKAAGREDLTRVRDRIIIRHDRPEAWNLAVELLARVSADFQASAIALWASEAAHGLHGDTLSAPDQWRAEARFYARLVEAVRERHPPTTLIAVLSQGLRDDAHVFTEILAGRPVEFVHYDGEWTYNAAPPALTTWAVAQSLQAGQRWLGKPAWVRVAYNGLPLAQPAKVHRETLELIDRRYIGVFANASRWITNPWNCRVGAATAWGGARAGLEAIANRLLAQEGEDRFTVADLLELEAIWTRLNLLNTPIGEGAPRFSAHRSLVYHMLLWVERAATDPAFTVSPFEEAYIWRTWHEQAAWLTRAAEQVAVWRKRLDVRPDDEARLWPRALGVLGPMLDLHAHSLAAAFIVCREASPDNSRGPWQAWRRLLGWHLVQGQEALEWLLAFEPGDRLSGESRQYEGDMFDDSADIAPLYQWGPPLRRMEGAVRNVLNRLEDPVAFATLKTTLGLSGYWPRGGLYSVLDWPVRLPPSEGAARSAARDETRPGQRH